MRAALPALPVLLVTSAASLVACDVFTARVPCAVDDECAATEACVEGFCATATRDDDGEDPGEVEGEGEGEGEGEVESHPLRGTECGTRGAPSVADPALRCSIFGVLEEPCVVDDDCGDPAARVCVDPGAGPPICRPSADFSRSACPDGPTDPDEVVDGNVDVPFECIDGSLSYVPSLRCGATGTAFGGPAMIGGDLLVRLDRRVEDAVFCDELQAVSFGTTAIGGSVQIGADGDGEQPAQLPSIILRDVTVIFGDYVLEGSDHIVAPALGSGERIGGDLILRDNAGMDTINLFSLIEVGGDVVIEDNPALDTLINTEPARIGGDLTVRNNPLLTCASLQPLVDVTEGTVTIDGLADACP